MDDKKINIITKDGGNVQVLEGAAFHTLTGSVKTTYRTSSISDFKLYIKDRPVQIFYNESGLIAYETELSYDTIPVAFCELTESEYLYRIKKANGSEMGFTEMETLLISLRDFIDTEAKKVLDFCSAGVVDKVVKMVRTKDNKGNYNFNVSRESGKDDFACPKTIMFSGLPMIDFVDANAALTFDMFLSYNEVNGCVSVTMQFVNLNLLTIIKEYKQTIIKNAISDISQPKFWGEFETVKTTDKWKYLAH